MVVDEAEAAEDTLAALELVELDDGEGVGDLFLGGFDLVGQDCLGGVLVVEVRQARGVV